MEVELAGHDELLGSVVAAHGGWLFKHTGDGICAAFPGLPHAALAAAVDAQRRLTIPVRMGIATAKRVLGVMITSGRRSTGPLG